MLYRYNTGIAEENFSLKYNTYFLTEVLGIKGITSENIDKVKNLPFVRQTSKESFSTFENEFLKLIKGINIMRLEAELPTVSEWNFKKTCDFVLKNNDVTYYIELDGSTHFVYDRKTPGTIIRDKISRKILEKSEYGKVKYLNIVSDDFCKLKSAKTSKEFFEKLDMIGLKGVKVIQDSEFDSAKQITPKISVTIAPKRVNKFSFATSAVAGVKLASVECKPQKVMQSNEKKAKFSFTLTPGLSNINAI